MFYYSVPGLQIEAPHVEGAESVLTPEALEFLVDLERRFRPERARLLARRAERQARLDAGELPDFLPETAAIRDADWKVAPIPADLQDRRVEITGPVDRKMIINALNSGATCSWPTSRTPPRPPGPTWSRASSTSRDAVRRHDRLRPTRRAARPTASTRAPPSSSSARAAGTCPRSTSLVDGEPMSGLPLRLRPLPLPQREGAAAPRHRPLLLPAQAREPPRGAPLERRLRPRPGARSASRTAPIKATVLIETILAAFEMDEILYELRDHIGRPQLRPLGLHLQLHQEAAQPTRRRPARPRAGHDDRALHARLLASS